jgi:hypothetical protein
MMSLYRCSSEFPGAHGNWSKNPKRMPSSQDP